MQQQTIADKQTALSSGAQPNVLQMQPVYQGVIKGPIAMLQEQGLLGHHAHTAPNQSLFDTISSDKRRKRRFGAAASWRRAERREPAAEIGIDAGR